MNQRLHAHLDGELPREALSPEEQVLLGALEAAIETVAAPLRSAPAPDLTARVMEALPAAVAPATAPSAARRAWRWLWRPRTLSLRFRPGLALAGGLVAAALAGVLLPRADTLLDPATPVLYVQFRLDAPGAEQVELAGSFTGWQPALRLRETAPGVWTALVPLEPGVHDYTFVVDGERWVVDPAAPRVQDSFGGSNNRLFLPAPFDRA